MGTFRKAQQKTVWVAIDVAKARHEALVELPNGSRRRTSIANTLAGFKRFADELRRSGKNCEIARR